MARDISRAKPLEYLRHPGFERPLAVLRQRYVRNDGAKGVVDLEALTDEEALALGGLLAGRLPRPPLPRRSFALDLKKVEAALTDAFAMDLVTALELVGGPVTTRAQARGTATDTRVRQRDAALAHSLCRREPTVRRWVEDLYASGRGTSAGPDLVRRALDVGDHLPAQPPVDRTRLAAELAAGDPHALDDRSRLSRLVLGQLAVRGGVERPVDAADRRALWQRFGVLTDPASSDVLILNLAPDGPGPLARALRGLVGCHFRLTLGQMTSEPPVFTACGPVYVCENPTVLVAAERAQVTAPLVCVGGWPSAAAVLLLDTLRAAGSELRYHGDFDAEGARIARFAFERLGAVPWRYDADAYRAAVANRPTRPLREQPSGDDPVAAALRAAGEEIHEEAVLEDLLGDLRRA